MRASGTARVVLAILIVLPQPIAPAVIVVGGDCTLAGAIDNANTDGDTTGGDCVAGSGADEIQLTEDVTLMAVLPAVSSEIELEGYDHTVRRDDGASDFRILETTVGGDLTIRNTTIANGYLTSAYRGGGIYNRGVLTLYDSVVTGNSIYSAAVFSYCYGGGIFSSGTLTLHDSIVSNNSVYGYYIQGGGILSTDTLTLFNSTVSDNEATADLLSSGGGIAAIVNATLENSTVSGNYAERGGGIYSNGDLSLVGSSVSDNSAIVGGGIRGSSGPVTLTDSTLSGNVATSRGGGLIVSGAVVLVTITNSTVSGNSGGTRGGGVYATASTVNFQHVTLSGNTAGSGGAIYNDSGSVALDFSVVANSAGGNCAGTGSIAHAYSLADDTTCGSVPDTLTGLEGALGYNGGPTRTHALLAGSTAIDRGNSKACSEGLDQRGAARDTDCDAGAFEFIPCPDLVLSDQTITTEEIDENCQRIVLGPNLTIAGTGDQTVRVGKQAVVGNGTSVEMDGLLTIEVDPDLQLVPP